MTDELLVNADVVLLDFDGVVVDTEYAGWFSWNEIFERYGLRLAEEDWAAQCGRATIFEPWEDLELAAGFPLDRTHINELRLRRRDELMEVLPGIHRFLAVTCQRGHRVGLVSNSPGEWIQSNLLRNDVDPEMFSVIVSGPGYAAKPSPERYLVALAALNAAVEDAVAVEDSAKGIRAAVAAGLRCVAVPNRITRHCDLSEAHYRLPSLDRLSLHRNASRSLPLGVEVAQSEGRLTDVRVYLAAHSRIGSIFMSALESEIAAQEAGLELVDIASVLAANWRNDSFGIAVAAAAASMFILDRVLAHRGRHATLHLIVCFGESANPKVVALLLQRMGAHGLLVVPASSPLCDIVNLDSPAMMLSCDETKWEAALLRLARCARGNAIVTPSALEQAMMAATVAARRSAALRGGVGAVLIDSVGETLLLGTAEVPRYGGGHYWDGDADDARDYRLGSDPATAVRLQTIERLLDLLASRGGTIPEMVTAVDLLSDFDRSEQAAGIGYGGALARTFESLGRVVHAEMAVLCHAARLGVAVKGLTLCVTACPCRQCLRHAVCAGIERVVYLGRANVAVPDFLADSVTAQAGDPQRMEMAPFEGITPGATSALFRQASPVNTLLKPTLPALWAELSQEFAQANLDDWRGALCTLPEPRELFREMTRIKETLTLERWNP